MSNVITSSISGIFAARRAHSRASLDGNRMVLKQYDELAQRLTEETEECHRSRRELEQRITGEFELHRVAISKLSDTYEARIEDLHKMITEQRKP